MEQKIRVGIVGCGGIANQKHMPSLKELPDVEMAAFCDIIEDRAVKAAKEYGGENAIVCTDYKQLIADPTIDVIHVLTPNKDHCQITVDALEGGKHVMCEKPMAKTYADAKKMLDAAKKTGKKLTIGYQSRYRQDALYLKRVCENGDLGEIYFAKAHAIRRRAVPTWGVFLDEEKQGGGPLIDIGTHALDLTLWMMDNYKPKTVMGSVYKKLGANGDCGNAFGPWDPKEFNVEDSAFGFITMENGATIILESAWALNTLDIDEAKTSLSGTKAGADMRDGLRINGDRYGKLYIDKLDLETRGVAFFTGQSQEPSVLEARAFYDAIKNDTEVNTKPEQAIVVTQILEAIYESAKTGKPIQF
ncbi:Gfo/Idh/MocA family oxidoreductase [Ruminococcaceae bacterium OttesenSCG-928-L11]|nr:Gfo/Idh/MocA family oxidoreductase [Ruminococcaceae bacterium OttesenSCG-928-L11]